MTQHLDGKSFQKGTAQHRTSASGIVQKSFLYSVFLHCLALLSASPPLFLNNSMISVYGRLVNYEFLNRHYALLNRKFTKLTGGTGLAD